MIITLCGSARFEKAFHAWNKALTLSGHLVFSLAAFPSIEDGREWYTISQKESLDQAHRDKIRASHAIVVLNCFAYIGMSTHREILHAMDLRKKVYTLESWGEGLGINTGCTHNTETAARVARYGLGIHTESPISTVHGMLRRRGVQGTYFFRDPAALLDRVKVPDHRSFEP